MTQTLLVLGGGGAIGSSVVAEGVGQGHRVHATVRSGGNRGRMPALQGAAVHACDVADEPAMLELLSNVKPDLLVMSALPAGHPAVGDSARAKYVEDILRLQFVLFRALQTTGATCRVVLIGSSTLYGGGFPRDPSSPIHPQNFRGVAKGCERLLAEMLSHEQGRQLVELRVFAAYGRWMSPKRLLSRLLRAALDGTRLPMSNGPLPRDWIHHSDIARAALASLSVPAGNGTPITVNMCSGEIIDCRDMAHRLERICGRTLIATESYDAADWMGEVLPGVPPAAGALPGWSRRVDADEGLADLWRWASTSEGRIYLTEGAC